MKKLNFYLEFLKDPKYYSTYFLVIFNCVFLVIFILLSYKSYEQYTLKQSLDTEVSTLKQNIDLIRNNQTILANDIDMYNSVLEQLIPDDESYFSVISALEKLSLQTGVNIASYSIDLEATTEEKLTLGVTIEGPPDVIESFIRDYRYISSRLLTNEEVSIDVTEEASTVFSVNFFHKKFEDTVDSAIQIQPADIEFMNALLSQLN